MQCGERRGEPSQEELLWLMDHIECESINQLYRDYSLEFNFPYFQVVSFRDMLARHNIFPITEYGGHKHLTRALKLMSQGPVHWTFKGRDLHEKISPPHWLWRWREEELNGKSGSGVRFLPPPYRVKERQFGETENLDG